MQLVVCCGAVKKIDSRHVVHDLTLILPKIGGIIIASQQPSQGQALTVNAGESAARGDQYGNQAGVAVQRIALAPSPSAVV
ncbi:hypothetical protein D4R89_06245 [bacterium]|nr:MAG: hypothetical protein D4R89_06245 [bacterium]